MSKKKKENHVWGRCRQKTTLSSRENKRGAASANVGTHTRKEREKRSGWEHNRKQKKNECCKGKCGNAEEDGSTQQR